MLEAWILIKLLCLNHYSYGTQSNKCPERYAYICRFGVDGTIDWNSELLEVCR